MELFRRFARSMPAMMSHAIRVLTAIAMIALVITTVIPCLTLAQTVDQPDREDNEPIWSMPGRLSIYDLRFGAAEQKDGTWAFLGDDRRFDVSRFGKRLTLMVTFSYYGSKADIPLRFVIKLPDARQYEDTVRLVNRRGKHTYKFTIHDPAEFAGSGSIYLYYGFSIVEVLDFTIVTASEPTVPSWSLFTG